MGVIYEMFSHDKMHPNKINTYGGPEDFDRTIVYPESLQCGYRTLLPDHIYFSDQEYDLRSGIDVIILTSDTCLRRNITVKRYVSCQEAKLS